MKPELRAEFIIKLRDALDKKSSKSVEDVLFDYALRKVLTRPSGFPLKPEAATHKDFH